MTLTVSFSSRNSPLTSTVIFFVRSPFATAVVTVGNVAHLRREIAGHQVDVLGQIFPGAGDAFDSGLAAQFAFRAHLTSDTRDFRSKGRQLIDHGVYDFRRPQKFSLELSAFDIDRHCFGKIALCHCADNAGHFARRMNEIADEPIDRTDRVGPRIGNIAQGCALRDASFLADDAPDSVEFRRQALIFLYDLIKGIRDFAGYAGPVVGETRRKIATFESHQSIEQLGAVAWVDFGSRTIFYRSRWRLTGVFFFISV